MCDFTQLFSVIFPQQIDEEETKALREKIIETRRAVHKSTEEEVSKRWSYEEGVSSQNVSNCYVDCSL